MSATDPSGYPVREWTTADIPVHECPFCGRPVYDVPEYGGTSGRVCLDALPLRAFRLVGHAEPYASLEQSDDTLRFSEHVCPL